MATWNPVQRDVPPQPDPIYAARYRQFRALYEQTRDIAADLSA